MLPPVLEIYVVWHTKDAEGQTIADTLLGHFRGTAFSGLIGGAVEVYVRSTPQIGDTMLGLMLVDEPEAGHRFVSLAK